MADLNERLSAKQKRKPYTHLACQFCKDKHLKCDGRRPACTTCAQKRQDCKYREERNRKRESASNRAQQRIEQDLREKIVLMHHEVHHWRRKYFQLKAAVKNSEIPMQFDSDEEGYIHAQQQQQPSPSIPHPHLGHAFGPQNILRRKRSYSMPEVPMNHFLNGAGGIPVGVGGPGDMLTPPRRHNITISPRQQPFVMYHMAGDPSSDDSLSSQYGGGGHMTAVGSSGGADVDSNGGGTFQQQPVGHQHSGYGDGSAMGSLSYDETQDDSDYDVRSPTTHDRGMNDMSHSGGGGGLFKSEPNQFKRGYLIPRLERERKRCFSFGDVPIQDSSAFAGLQYQQMQQQQQQQTPPSLHVQLPNHPMAPLHMHQLQLPQQQQLHSPHSPHSQQVSPHSPHTPLVQMQVQQMHAQAQAQAQAHSQPQQQSPMLSAKRRQTEVSMTKPFEDSDMFDLEAEGLDHHQHQAVHSQFVDAGYIPAYPVGDGMSGYG